MKPDKKQKKEENKKEEIVEDDKAPIGSFNKAFGHLTHLERLELTCSEAQINNNFDIWHATLHTWLNKLSGKIRKLENGEESLKLITDWLNNAEPYLHNDLVQDIYKRKMLNKIQRELERYMDTFGYQMPEQGGDDDEDLDFR